MRGALREARLRFGEDFVDVLPSVSNEALKQLKFAELLPSPLAAMTLGARAADPAGAAEVADLEIAESRGRIPGGA